jgi:hypothetical protein
MRLVSFRVLEIHRRTNGHQRYSGHHHRAQSVGTRRFLYFYACSYLRLNLHLSLQAYEEKNMVPSVTSRDLAEYTLGELLRAVPGAFGLRALARRMLLCLVDDRSRIAMMCVCWFRVLVMTFLIFKIQGFQPNPWFCILSSNLPCKLQSLHRDGCCSRGRNRGPCVPLLRTHLPWLSTAINQGCIPASTSHSLLHLRHYLASADHRIVRFQAEPWYKPVSASPVFRMWDQLMAGVGYYQAVPGEEFKSGGYRLEELVSLVPIEGNSH